MGGRREGVVEEKKGQFLGSREERKDTNADGREEEEEEELCRMI